MLQCAGFAKHQYLLQNKHCPRFLVKFAGGRFAALQHSDDEPVLTPGVDLTPFESRLVAASRSVLVLPSLPSKEAWPSTSVSDSS